MDRNVKNANKIIYRMIQTSTLGPKPRLVPTHGLDDNFLPSHQRFKNPIPVELNPAFSLSQVNSCKFRLKGTQVKILPILRGATLTKL